MRLPLLMRSQLFRVGFQVKNQGLCEIPFFSITDLGLVPVLGWKQSLAFLRNFRDFRKNIKQRGWSCLTSFYPRSYYLLYYFLLFWWADYCNVLRVVLECPDRTFIAEAFFRYIVEVDRIIDNPQNGQAMLMEPSYIKGNPAVLLTLKLFFNQLIIQSNVPDRVKQQLSHMFWEYRHECLLACQQVLPRRDNSLDDVLDFKEKTSGGLFQVWSSILNAFFCKPESQMLAENSGLVLSKACLAMQILEDMMDLPEDHRAGSPNIFHEIIKMHPEELAAFDSYLRKYPWQHMDGLWAKEFLSKSFNAAMGFVNVHLDAAVKISLRPDKTDKLRCLISKGQSHPIGI